MEAERVVNVAELIEALGDIDPALPVWVNCGDPYDLDDLNDVVVVNGPEARVELCS